MHDAAAADLDSQRQDVLSRAPNVEALIFLLYIAITGLRFVMFGAVRSCRGSFYERTAWDDGDDDSRSVDEVARSLLLHRQFRDAATGEGVVGAGEEVRAAGALRQFVQFLNFEALVDLIAGFLPFL